MGSKAKTAKVIIKGHKSENILKILQSPGVNQ